MEIIPNHKSIYIKPVDTAIKELENTNKSTSLLCGLEGTGKTVVLQQYMANQRDLCNPIIDATFTSDDLFFTGNVRVFELSQICFVLQKMLLYVNQNYQTIDFTNILVFAEKLSQIRRKIYSMHFYGKLEVTNPEIKELCNHPETLLEEFLNILIRLIDIKSITIVMDNFDVVAGSCKHYQEYMYKLLTHYMRLILTISDSDVISNAEKINELNIKNNVVMLPTIKKVDEIKEIIDAALREKGYIHERVGLILSDETVSLITERTNGNLFDIIKAINALYVEIYKGSLAKAEYDVFVLNYIDEKINRNPVLTGFLKLERKCYL